MKQETCAVCGQSSHRKHWYFRFGGDREHPACEHHVGAEYLARAEQLALAGNKNLAEEFIRFAKFLETQENEPLGLSIRQVS